MAQRQNISSGSSRELVLGHSRAVRVGNQVFVAGATAGSADGAVGCTDAAARARKVFSRVETALTEAGAGFTDVVRTRVHQTNIADSGAVGAVHGEIFGEVRSVTGVVDVGALAAEDLPVEAEADALLR
ncbi:RidA family protein [Streptomyces hebeiensis]|uniref:RidA family protein n=1 Tax=Streptomyces hebeiensis TaxID=229486 RepID=A0ABP4FQK4_9ACTN